MDSSSDNNETRRSFLKKAGALTVTASGIDFGKNSLFAAEKGVSDSPVLPWYRKNTRWGQTNITETDPATYDISWWRSYWKKTHIQGIIVNAGGIVAYYPSKIPLHRHAEYLGGKDLFGELCRTAHEDGLSVFARMDSNRAHREFYDAHPGWFAADVSGKPYKAGEMFVTCVNGPYYNEHIPAIIREIARLYHPEGFTDNSWSGLGRDSICYCENCRRSFSDKYKLDLPLKTDWDDKVYRQWIVWNYERRLEIWDLNNSVSKASGGKDCIWSGMNSSSISGQSASFRDFREICKRAEIIMLDSQARNDLEGFQQNAISGKLIRGILGSDKLIPESMAMYQAGRPVFRLSAKPAREARMWMYEGLAGGIQPWWHHVGAYHEDRRMYETAEPVMAWHEANEEYLTGRQPVANVGVVWSQENSDFFGRGSVQELVELPWRGITQALIRARIQFIPVNAGYIDRDSDKLDLLILPDIGSLTDSQTESVRNFVKRGGNLFATGYTSLFDKWGEPHEDYGLSDIFGAHLSGKASKLYEELRSVRSAEAAHTYFRLLPGLRKSTDGPHRASEPPVSGSRHPVLEGFEKTDILPFGGFLNPVKTDTGSEIVMTFIPAFPIYPPETAWMRTPETDIPALILRTDASGGKIAFMPADIDKQYGKYNLPDHGNLLTNIIMWTLGGRLPLVVDGPGLIDCNLYRQSDRLILHIVNLTNTAAWRQPVDEILPAGPFRVKIKLYGKNGGKKVKLLVSGKLTEAAVENGWSIFDIEKITDHEVAVVL